MSTDATVPQNTTNTSEKPSDASVDKGKGKGKSILRAVDAEDDDEEEEDSGEEDEDEEMDEEEDLAEIDPTNIVSGRRTRSAVNYASQEAHAAADIKPDENEDDDDDDVHVPSDDKMEE